MKLEKCSSDRFGLISASDREYEFQGCEASGKGLPLAEICSAREARP